MINELLNEMSVDMNIPRYKNESDESFVYRLCYSALGLWCLNIANSITSEHVGVSKQYQTNILNNLLNNYIKLNPEISRRFYDSDNPNNISVIIRRVYEETGYLLTDEMHNRLACFGRSIVLGDQALFFGLPKKPYTVNGLGIFTSPSKYTVSIKEFLIRDSLTCDEYLKSKYEIIDFYEKNISLYELEFFNPISNNPPSLSWTKNLQTNYSVARISKKGPFYRVMKIDERILFADEPIEESSDSFTSHEYRRLYFALKKYYGKPLKAKILKLDNQYSKLILKGQLPYREYYFLLLLAWPERNAFDKINFIIKNYHIKVICTLLENIGIEIDIGGYIHE